MYSVYGSEWNPIEKAMFVVAAVLMSSPASPSVRPLGVFEAYAHQ